MNDIKDEWEEQFVKTVGNPLATSDELWLLPEDHFLEWRRKHDYPKLIASFNQHKPNFVKWKNEFGLTDEQIMAYTISACIKHKGPDKDKQMFLLEQTFDGVKRLMVAHADLSNKPPMFPEKGEAYILIKKFISYADWCDQKKIPFDLFNIKTRQAPGYAQEKVWLDTGYELLKMGGRKPPTNAFGILLRGKHMEFVNLCGLVLEGEINFGSEGNLDLAYCAVDHLRCDNMDFPGMWLWHCSLENVSFENSMISHWKFWQCQFSGDIKNCRIRMMRIYGGKFVPYIRDTQVIGVFADHKGLAHHEFKYTYVLFKKLFDTQGNDDDASKYYIKERELERELSTGWRWLIKSLSYQYWAYGKRPERIIYLSIFVIVFFGFIYWMFPGSIKPVAESKSFLDSLYFSTVTFTTVGYGDLTPTGWIRVLVIVQAFLGPINIGFLIAGYSRSKY